MAEGVLAGYPVVDVKVSLIDGSYHTVDSSEMAFKIAGSMGFKKGVESATRRFWNPSSTSTSRSPTNTWAMSSATSTAAAAA